jgi:hypothetical protein
MLGILKRFRSPGPTCFGRRSRDGIIARNTLPNRVGRITQGAVNADGITHPPNNIEFVVTFKPLYSNRLGFSPRPYL